MKISTLSDLLSILSGLALWVPAYQASLIKLSQSRFTAPPDGVGKGYSRAKRWLRTRLENKERTWTDRHHTLLIIGFALMILASLLRFLSPS